MLGTERGGLAHGLEHITKLKGTAALRGKEAMEDNQVTGREKNRYKCKAAGC